MENERWMKFNDIALEVLKEGYEGMMKAYKEKIFENFREFNDAEYATGLITMALNFSSSIIYRLCKANPAIEPEVLLNDFIQLILDALREQDKKLH